jgi:aminoglycoside/choline kinase family phosphotransferase
LLLEDVGADDLWTHREAPWSARRELYAQALEQLARLHAADLHAAESAKLVQSPFDAALYRWEQDYFFDHFLGKEHAANLRVSVPLDAQAAGLAERPRVLLHRDFQSQNIMVREGRVYLIDFQGMRAGLAGYDVASLLYDPYVLMTDEERREMSAYYAQTAGRVDSAAWNQELRACARQRLMQALGAYGFLGRIKGRRHFLAHIPVAAERLAALCDEGAWQLLAEAVRAATRHSP